MSSSSAFDAPSVGMTFESIQEAKKSIVQWCVREGIPYKVRKADKRCWLLTCKEEDCNFRLRVKNEDNPVITKLEPHSCSSLLPSIAQSYLPSIARSTRPSIAPSQGPIKAIPYDWPHDASFGIRTTALVIVDMQRDCKLS